MLTCCNPVPWAISAASSVRIGNMIGSGLPNQSRLAARISLLLIVLAGSFSRYAMEATGDNDASTLTSLVQLFTPDLPALLGLHV